MAIAQKITELAALAAADAADLLAIVDDPAGGAATKNIVASAINQNFVISVAEEAPTNLLFERGNVLRYGADPTGAVSSSTAFANALLSNDLVRVPDGTYLVSNLLMTLRHRMVGDSWDAILQKEANGPILTMGFTTSIAELSLEGDGANFTGSNIVISVGDNVGDPDLYGDQFIDHCKILESASFCVEYDTANRGVFSKISQCLMNTFNNNNACVKWPDEPATVGSRIISQCETFGSDLVDVGGADNGIIINCPVIHGPNGGIIFPAGTVNDAAKLIIMGNRLASVATMQVRGTKHIITNNESGQDIELLSGTANVLLGPNVFASGKGHIDSSGAQNFIYDQDRSTFTPTFAGDGGSEAFGNAEIRGEFWREGEWVVCKLQIIFGSTTNFGGANWTFTVPLNNVSGVTTEYSGSAKLKDRSGSCVADMNTDLILVYHSTGRIGVTSPVTWADGDKLVLEVKYRI